LAFMPSYATSDSQGLGIALRRHSELALDDLQVVDAMRVAVAT
jgi:hypothetical protein